VLATWVAPCGSIVTPVLRGTMGTETSIMHERVASAATVPMDAVVFLLPLDGRSSDPPAFAFPSTPGFCVAGCVFRFSCNPLGDGGGVCFTVIMV